ncbi:transposase [Actinomyces procaprae]|uniref:transposase n=1 Tax=Actinomyces procaprae TaxID=2560010 RepID=UPI003CD0DCF1
MRRAGQQGPHRGVLIVCCDGLTGLPEATRGRPGPTPWPRTCVVHLIRASMRFVAYGDRKQAR